MLRPLNFAAFTASFAFLCACGGGTQTVPPSTASAMQNAARPRSPGGFTEYPVPSGVAPRYVTVASGGIVWFGNDVNIGSSTSNEIFGRLHGGKVTMIALPSATQNVFGGFATAFDKGVWGIAVDDTIDEGQDYLVRAKGVGAPTAFPTTDDNQYWALAVGPDGRLWDSQCLEACGAFPGGVLASRNADNSAGPGVGLPSFYFAVALAAGPDGNLWASVRNGGPPDPHDSYVYKISTSGTILQQILLPDGSNPYGLTTGPDGNVWVTEPGTNEIARVTPGGAVTQFPLTTKSAQPQQITAADDGALWFTEMGANAIGRIAIGGTVTQYPIPTPNSQPFGIASAGRCPGAHATIWFSEFAAGKIGKLRV